MELAYAETSHANQGRTVDRSLLLLDGPTDVAGVYVPMTRGRLSNEAFVVVRGEQTPVDVLGEAMSRHWIDDPAVLRRAELQRAEAGGDVGHIREAELLDPGTVKALLEREHGISEELRHLVWKVSRLERELAENERTQPHELEAIARHRGRIEDATRQLEEYDRPFKRRRHEVEIDHARRTIATAQGDIEQSTAAIAKAEGRRPQLERDLAAAREALSDRPALEAERRDVRERLSADLAARATGLRRDPSEPIVKELGDRPSRGRAAAMWDDAAARIDQHRKRSASRRIAASTATAHSTIASSIPTAVPRSRPCSACSASWAATSASSPRIGASVSSGECALSQCDRPDAVCPFPAGRSAR